MNLSLYPKLIAALAVSPPPIIDTHLLSTIALHNCLVSDIKNHLQNDIQNEENQTEVSSEEIKSEKITQEEFISEFAPEPINIPNYNKEKEKRKGKILWKH